MKHTREDEATGPEEWDSGSGGGGGPLPEVQEQTGIPPDRLSELRERLTRLGELTPRERNFDLLREDPGIPQPSQRGLRA